MRLRGHVGGVVAVLVLLAGCATGTSSLEASPVGSTSTGATAPQSASAAPSSTPSVTPTPAPTDTPSPTPAATPIPPLAKLSLATVAVGSLNVRVAPSASAALLKVPTFAGGKNPLTSGDQVLVVDGPVDADGYRWYAVGLSQDPGYTSASTPVGWVAAASGATAWLVPDTNACPKPGVTAISAMSFIARVGCFGPGSISFAAHQAAIPLDAGLGGACQPPPGQPGWLVCDNIGYDWVNADGGTTWLLLLHFDPATGVSPTGLAPVGTIGPAYQITGHFDDPAAQACSANTDPKDVGQLSDWLTCATKFVVETLSPG